MNTEGSAAGSPAARRMDPWGIFHELEQIYLESCDRIVGMDLENLVVDGYLVKAPCDVEAAGKFPVYRYK